ncbi:hypothetical protein EIP91_009225 [Steccherinum ochraceum]|uniref:F-box domain-containing protein n=1 Tax=Steccherinum ochraceum TaxID=92696 RepID=A0A4R0RPD5_9APHY|nr:hypothetical protein EIP91_009225 [Steccherinum ochraceum]
MESADAEHVNAGEADISEGETGDSLYDEREDRGDNHRASQMTLDWDILLEIMSVVVSRSCYETTTPDLSRLSRTCRTLYEVGVPLLLGCDMHVGFQDSDSFQDMASLASFIHRHRHRAHLVRRLTIFGFPDKWEATLGTERNFDDVADQFGRALERCVQLEMLWIESYYDQAFCHAAVAKAITSLRCLQEIRFNSVGPRGMHVVQNMRSPVTSASIKFQYDAEYGHRDPSIILHGFAESLTNITIRYARSIASGYDRQPGGVTRYPKVRSITFEETCSFDVNSFDFAAAFPNLRELIWHNDYDAYLDDAEETRACYLHDIQTGYVHRHASWETLDTLILSNIDRLYSLALTCQVDLWGGASLTGDETQLARFWAILGDILPSRLEVEVAVGLITQERQLFPVLAMTHLEMRIILPNATYTDVNQVLNGVAHKLQSLASSLTHLCLVVDYSPRTNINDRTLASLRSLSIVPHAIQMFNLAPHLRHVFFKISHAPEPGLMWSLGLPGAEDASQNSVDDPLEDIDVVAESMAFTRESPYTYSFHVSG